MKSISQLIAEELKVRVTQVDERGRKEGFLRLSVGLPDEGVDGPTEPVRRA